MIRPCVLYLELSGCGKKLVTERGEPYVLAVGPTHAEIRAFTADVRAEMRSEGALSGPVIKRRPFIVHDSTRAMRRDSNTYTLGMAVTLVSEKGKSAWSFRSRSVHSQKPRSLAWVDGHF